MFQKIKRVRDAGYLKFVRSLPCQLCQAPAPSNSHHTDSGGIALVGDDTSAVPLCVRCHSDIHQHHSKRGTWGEDELKAILAGLFSRYERAKEKRN